MNLEQTKEKLEGVLQGKDITAITASAARAICMDASDVFDDGDGDIVFQSSKGAHHCRIEIDSEGIISWLVFFDCKLIEASTMQYPAAAKVASTAARAVILEEENKDE